MGILFVLLFWGLLGLLLAIVGALVARKITASLLPLKKGEPEPASRMRAMRYSTLLPFGCLFWAVAVFMFQGVVNTTYLHRDIGLGDSFYTPLPNGYAILMVDVGDRGTIYKPKTQADSRHITEQPDTISGVRRLQIAGAEILGGIDSRYAQNFDENNPTMDRYFLLDTRTGTRTDFPTRSALRAAAFNRGIKLKLEPIFSVYRRYRVTWFDILAVCLMALPPILAVVLFLGHLARLHGAHNASGPPEIHPAQT
jgi:hypothetical protein